MRRHDDRDVERRVIDEIRVCHGVQCAAADDADVLKRVTSEHADTVNERLVHDRLDACCEVRFHFEASPLGPQNPFNGCSERGIVDPALEACPRFRAVGNELLNEFLVYGSTIGSESHSFTAFEHAKTEHSGNQLIQHAEGVVDAAREIVVLEDSGARCLAKQPKPIPIEKIETERFSNVTDRLVVRTTANRSHAVVNKHGCRALRREEHAGRRGVTQMVRIELNVSKEQFRPHLLRQKITRYGPADVVQRDAARIEAVLHGARDRIFEEV